MLLRRVTNHVQNQNWFAVFIDFIIVVVGVFIGIQVANWNEARVEAVREQEVLVAVFDDLQLDLDVLETGSAMARANIDTSNYILQQSGFKLLNKITIPVANSQLERQEIVIPPPGSISEERKKQLWKLVTVRYFPAQSNTAFSSLIAAGDLKIISDPSLISELQSYAQLWNSIEVSNDTTYRPFRDRAVFVGQEYGLSPFSFISEKELIGLVKANPKLEAVVRTMLEYTVLHRSQIERIKQSTESLIIKVSKEIK
jgi:hypothetical protein